MDPKTRDLAVTTAIFLGALILFGPLTWAIVVVTADELARVAGLGGLADLGIGASVVRVLAVVVAGEIVTEVTAVQLGGVDALWRGSQRLQYARHALLWAVLLAGIAIVVSYVARIAPAVLGPDGNPSAIVLTLLTIAAICYAAVRTALEFREGLAETE